MQCPHCRAELDAKTHVFALGEDPDGAWQVSNTRCPTCDRLVVALCTKDGCTYPVRPLNSTRARLSEDVPAEYADDYHSASQIISYSPEASAAISRRSLHRFLATKVHAGHGGLADQIRQATLAPDLPAYLKQALRMVATVAKLEPDSIKSLQPEALAPAEPGEADWLLDVLEPLFDLYFVQPARMQRKQDAMEENIAPPAPPAPSSEVASTAQETDGQAAILETDADTEPALGAAAKDTAED